MVAVDVAERLKTYARTHVQTVKDEYEKQIGKWESYIDDVADAEIAARKDFNETLRDIKREEEEAGKLALMALSLVAIPALAWVGAEIELNLYPRLMGKTIIEDGFVKGKYVVRAEREVNEFAAKFFGDSIKDYLGHGLDKTFESLFPEGEDGGKNGNNKDESFWNSIASGDLAGFKTRLSAELRAKSSVVSGQLMILRENINKKREFGDLVIKEVHKRFPKSKTREDDGQLELNGYAVLDEYFDTLRKQYARNWFYYGNNPITSRLPLLPFHIQVEIWALWILGQQWKTRYTVIPDDLPGKAIRLPHITNGDFELDKIVEALGNLASKETSQFMRSPTLASKDEWDTVHQLYRAAEPEPADTDDLTRRADSRLDAVLGWAKSNPGKILHGNLDFRPRNLGTIANVKSILSDN